MAEVGDLSVNPAANTGRWPNGMPVSNVNEAGRDDEALLARFHKDTSCQLATLGTSLAYEISPFRTITEYASGLTFIVRAHVACGTPASNGTITFMLIGLSAKPLKRQSGENLRAGDILIHQPLHIVFNSALDAFVCLGIGDPSSASGMPPYAKAALPPLTETRMIFVTDEAGGPIPAFSDGTNWRRVSDRAIVS